jgi:hypothetical protein
MNKHIVCGGSFCRPLGVLSSGAGYDLNLLNSRIGKLARCAVFMLGLLTGGTGSLNAQNSVVISEFMADNATILTDNDGQYSDWIELYNASSSPVNLGGWYLTDVTNNLTKWRLPATNLNAHAFLLIFASGKDRALLGAPLHTSFALSSKGEYLALVKPDGVTRASEFFPVYPEQYPDVSYGLGKSATMIASNSPIRVLVPTSGALGATWTSPTFNDSAWTSGINGVGYETVVPGFAVRTIKASGYVDSLDAAEAVIATPAQQAAVYGANTAVINFFNSGGSGNYFEDINFPGLDMNVDVEDFVVEVTGTITIPSVGNWTFGVNSDDGFGLDIGGQQMSYPSPRGPSDTLATFYFSSPGNYPLRLVFYERGGGSELEFWAAPGSYSYWDSTQFHLVGDTATGGLAVTSTPVAGGGGTGYRSMIGTDLQSLMLNKQVSAFVRVPFQATNVAALESISLKVRYDDGFVVYLNGTELARRNAPSSPAWNTPATAAHAGQTGEVIDLTPFKSFFREGANLLAIHGMNDALTGADFFLQVELVEFSLGSRVYGYCAPATPSQPNLTTSPSLAAPVQFSPVGGVFTSNQVVSLFCPMPGAVIRYTLDNKVPTANSPVYVGPITASNSVAIRAQAFVTGLLPGMPETEIYTILDSEVSRFSSKLPLVIINAYGQSIVPDMAPRASATMTLIDVAKSTGRATLVGKPEFHGRIGIEGRGQTSWGFPKKPFNVETRGEHDQDKPVAWLGMPSGSDWVLLNVYNDKTFMNDFMAHELFGKMGHYAVRHHYVEVFLNGARPEGGSDASAKVSYDDYVGIYLLLEKIKIDPDRVDIAHLSADDSTEPAISGGYIFKKDKDSPGDVGFGTAYGQYLKFHDPPGNELTQTQRDWLANYVNQFEGALYGVNWTDPINGYRKYLELNSFVDNHWMVEFTKQIDGYRLSNYLHKDRGGKIKMEPIWDWNLSFGNADYLEGEFPQGWYWPLISSGEHIWLRRLIAEPGDPDFNQKITDRWSVLRTNILSATNIIARMDELALLLDEAQARDFQRWPRLGSYIWPNPSGIANATTYPAVLSWVKNWLRQRYAWIDSQMILAPSFSRAAGPVNAGSTVALTAPRGTIYYTLNGTDPRAAGGALAAGALTYGSPVTITANARVFARARYTNGWSGPAAATYVTQTPPLVITEIMYHPAPPPSGSTNTTDDFQFIELMNVGASSLNLAGFKIAQGIEFTFAGGTLAAGQRVVIVRNRDAFVARYGTQVNIGGVFSHSLAHNGESLNLLGPLEEPILDFAYNNSWDLATDGNGFSLVVANERAALSAWSDPANWRRSGNIGGSPGVLDVPVAIGTVVINEVLTHTDPPMVDAIELANPTGSPVDISYWYLTDDAGLPQKFRIPAGTIVPANSYVVFTETQFNSVAGNAASFALDSQGDEVFLFSANASGVLTGHNDGFAFGAAANGVSFGRYTNSAGEVQFPAQRETTLGRTNAGPRVGPVVINEIHYHPASNDFEFIELKNITDQPVPCFDVTNPANTWRLNGVGFDFPTNVTMAPRGLLLLVGADPAAFRSKYAVPAQVSILGPYDGTLQGGGELLQLQRPDAPEITTNNGTRVITVPYITVDAVRYHDHAPWPTNADGFGPSLERIRAEVYGDDPANWRASLRAPSPGLDNTGNRAPTVNAGADQTVEATSFPVTVTLSGTASDDGTPQPPGVLTIGWSQVSGPGPVAFEATNRVGTTIAVPGVGTYVLRLTANDGETGAYDELAVTVTRTATQSAATLISWAADWKYLDNGSDQGTAWRGLTFDDRSWRVGRGQLGYGDGDEATVVSYGTNASAKFATTYFRKAFALSNAASIIQLTLQLVRDDGAVVYLNGTEVLRDNVASGQVTYLTWAVNSLSGADETNYLEQTVSPALLRQGTNVIAVEVHQANATSSDLSFDLRLDAVASASNRAPTANAGPDQTLNWPTPAVLRGSFTDDGLPNPPGISVVSWSKLSGPGTLTFARINELATTVSGALPGNYVVRLSVFDGALTAVDDMALNLTDATGQYESVLPPSAITGTNRLAMQQTLLVIASGASSSYGHVLEYQFDWGDGTLSAWSGASQTKAYQLNGTYGIQARTRCGAHPNQVSAWSGVKLNVTVGGTNQANADDLNGDRYSDLLLQHTNGTLAVWSMNGAAFAGGAYLTPSQIGGGWRLFGSTDLNLDGKTDLLFLNDDRSLGAWFMNRLNMTGASFLNPAKLADGWRLAGTGYFDADQNKDLVLQHADGWLAVWLMNQTTVREGKFLNPSRISDLSWQIVGAGDFDRDGKTDVLFQNQATGDLALWFMDGVNLVSARFLSPSYPGAVSARVAAIADFDGDGKPDLVINNSGVLETWFMDGANRKSRAVINVNLNAAPGWNIVGPR